MERRSSLLAALAACVAASLVHHVHNAEFLGDYPNLPPSLTRGTVYAAWSIEALIGVLGYLLYRAGRLRVGLALMAIYAVIGFGGLAHYHAAPLAAHTAVMNATIWLEAVTAAVLLAAVIRAWPALHGGINR